MSVQQSDRNPQPRFCGSDIAAMGGIYGFWNLLSQTPARRPVLS